MTKQESVGRKRFLTAGELEAWTVAGEKNVWSPNYEIVDSGFAINLTVDLPRCGLGDIQIALLPNFILLKQKVRLLACRSWSEFVRALFGPSDLFRRFDMPALIDVNRVKAELQMGVLSIMAPKQTAIEQPAKGTPQRSQAFAA